MTKLLILFDDSLSIQTNGAINSLKNILDYVPDDYDVTVTTFDMDSHFYKNVNVLNFEGENNVKLWKKMWGSVAFAGHKVNGNIVEILNNNQYDHIIFSMSYNNVYYKYLLGTEKASIIVTDLPSFAFANYIRNTKNIIKLFFYLKEYIWSLYYERQVVKRYKNIILVNKNEVQIANEKYGCDKFIQIPVVFSMPANVLIAEKECQKINLVFIGNMGFRPNKDGIELFYKEIFEYLPSNYQLHIIGKGSEKLFLDDFRVHRYGFVKDFGEILPYMNFGICYMKNGGGMKNKVFDYMKYGVPCIINEYVNKNNFVDSDYIYVANNISEFQQVINNTAPNPKDVIDSIQEYNVVNVASEFWKLFEEKSDEN